MECFILAGGQSRRFGEDKLLFRLGSKRTIERVIEVARKVYPEVRLVAKSGDKFKDLDVEVVEDLLPDQAPIIGLYTALSSCKGDRAMILSGDTPLIKPEILKLLMEEFKEPATLLSSEGRIHPLIGIYSRSLLPVLKDYIDSGGRSLIRFLEETEYKLIGEDSIRRVDPRLLSLINMNTREDLKEIVRWI